eukprot:TRINITY_DN17985_c0_g1_i2.p1 TRINITY_DN17985_c0_g1~~TRINITY_DN17985_c0_g1_i2.p1  ORF type:complete len:199 (+),score=43.50 TRINITY_DN17985_c0_g1_i2:116-712(+)
MGATYGCGVEQSLPCCAKNTSTTGSDIVKARPMSYPEQDPDFRNANDESGWLVQICAGNSRSSQDKACNEDAEDAANLRAELSRLQADKEALLLQLGQSNPLAADELVKLREKLAESEREKEELLRQLQTEVKQSKPTFTFGSVVDLTHLRGEEWAEAPEDVRTQRQYRQSVAKTHFSRDAHDELEELFDLSQQREDV